MRPLLIVLLLATPAWSQTADEPGAAGGAAGPGVSGPASIPTPPASTPTPPAASTLTPPPLSPTAPTDTWYYAVHGRKAGPFTTRQLRDMAQTHLLPPDTLVWRPGQDGWRQLSEVASLRAPPIPTTGERQRNRRLVRAGALTFGISGGVGVLMALTLVSADCGDECNSVAKVIWIPVVGPVVSHAVDDIDGTYAATPWLIVWSVAQATGLGLLIAGVVGRKVDPPPTTASAGLRWSALQIAPVVGEVNGIGIGGRW